MRDKNSLDSMSGRASNLPVLPDNFCERTFDVSSFRGNSATGLGNIIGIVFQNSM